MENEAHTIHVSRIATYASNFRSGLGNANAAKPLKEEDMVLHDTVRYSGLIFQKNLILNDIV